MKGPDHARRSPKHQDQAQGDHEEAERRDHRHVFLEENGVVRGVERYVAGVEELDAVVFGPMQNGLDRFEADLRIEVGETVPAVRVEPDVLDRIDARAAHLHDDRAELGVGADEPAHIKGLLHHFVSDDEELFLRFGELREQVVDEDVVGRRSFHELGVRKARHVFDEGDLVFERSREELDLPHHREVPCAAFGAVHDVPNFVGFEVVAVLQVRAVGRVVRIEECRNAVVDAGARREITSKPPDREAGEQHDPAVVVGPAPDRFEKLAEAGHRVCSRAVHRSCTACLFASRVGGKLSSGTRCRLGSARRCGRTRGRCPAGGYSHGPRAGSSSCRRIDGPPLRR